MATELTHKICGKCKQDKAVSEFFKQASRKDGYQIWCKACKKAQQIAWRENNREKTNAYARDGYIKHKDRIKKYQSTRKDKLAEATRRWRERNPGYVDHGSGARVIAWKEKNKDKVLAWKRERWHAEDQRMPLWADRRAILAKYKEAKTMTLVTGIKHTVDHYYPLRGKTVSGLHVATNLRVIPARENFKKRAKVPVVDRALL